MTFTFLFFLWTTLICATSSSFETRDPQLDKPNILFILVDDLGWNNVGFHNPNSSEVITPNMDYLATSAGLQLNRHYVHYTCSPTRSSFQSGRIPFHVNMLNENVVNNQLSGVPVNMTCIATKLQNAGYESHFVGKWDAGSATADQLPIHRGYLSSLGYLGHSNSYWDYREGGNPCLKYGVPNIIDLWNSTHPAYDDRNTGEYEEFMFSQRVYDLLDNYSIKQNSKEKKNENPFFIVYAPHIGHSPLQIPEEYLMTFEDDESLCGVNRYLHPVFPGYNGTYHCRSIYQSMINLLDVIIGNITRKLQHHKLWDNTLIVLSSDNGGELLLSCCAANNHPLRGGKFTPFEGGIRATSFVSGGYLPSSRRGEIEEGMIHIADWYTTFVSMLGIDIDDDKAMNAGLPAVDGLNMWPLISGKNKTSPRRELIVDNNTLIMGQYKLMKDEWIHFATWTGNVFPNTSSVLHPPDAHFLRCKGEGCLFDVVSDPGEHMNLVHRSEEMKKIAREMGKRLDELRLTFYSNNQSAIDLCSPNVTIPCCCMISKSKYHGFYGPYQQIA